MALIVLFLMGSFGVVFGGFYLVLLAQEQNTARAFISFFVLIFGGYACILFVSKSIIRKQTLGEIVKFDELDKGKSYQVVKTPRVVAVEEEINLSQKTLRLVDAASIPEGDIPMLIIGRRFDIKGKKICLHEMRQLSLHSCSR